MIHPPPKEPVTQRQGWCDRLVIRAAADRQRDAREREATHVVGIGCGPSGSDGADRFLRLDFDDVTDVTDVSRAEAPTSLHLERALAFVDGLPGEASLEVRCRRGISRSTALALGLLAREVRPLRAAFLLHGLRPFACPNPLVVRLWDDLLGFEGGLVEVAGHFPTVFWRHGDGRVDSRAAASRREPRTARRRARSPACPATGQRPS